MANKSNPETVDDTIGDPLDPQTVPEATVDVNEAGLSETVNAQGEPIPVAHDALHPGAAADQAVRAEPPLPVAPDHATVGGYHNVNGTHTTFTVAGCGEGRHLVEIRVKDAAAGPLPSGDVFRHAFSGDTCEFAVEGLAATGTATVTNLQGDGRPQDVGGVTAGQGAEIRFDVEPLDADMGTPQPDPGLAPAPSVAFAAVPPTEEEIRAAQDQAAADAAAGEHVDAGVPPGEGSTVPGSTGAGALGEAEHDGGSPAPPSLSLPGPVDVNGDPLPEGTEVPGKVADGTAPDSGMPSAPGGPDGRDLSDPPAELAAEQGGAAGEPPE